MRRNVLITGASSGLGQGMARQLAARGHSIALAARRTDLLAELRAELRRANRRIEVRAYELDVRDGGRVHSVFRDAIGDFGHLDRVVVNAGVGRGRPIGTGGFHVNRDIVETNLLGALAQCEAAMAHFYERGSGHLVVVSSIAAATPLPGNRAAYAATKAAVRMLADSIRADARRRARDIAVTTLFPAYIRSGMATGPGRRWPPHLGTDRGAALMTRMIEREVASAVVPWWPWRLLTRALRHLPPSAAGRIL